MTAKRIFDLLLVLPGLLLFAPVFALIALWIKLDSPGPVFFRQERVGLNGKNFRIYKFRTMVMDAENSGLKITVGKDSRITRSGEYLRKYKLDELPQLLNVLLGEMSLVGPRPEVPEYVEAGYSASQRKEVFSVRPGITDNASILFRSENEILEGSQDPNRTYLEEILPIKIRHYQEYARNHSVWIDIVILLRTIQVVLRG